MKSLYVIILFALLLLGFGCRENIVEFTDETKTGKLYIISYPSGAEIFFENNKTGKVTPDSLISLNPGNYTVKLRLTGYADETVAVNVSAGQKRFINVSFGLWKKSF